MLNSFGLGGMSKVVETRLAFGSSALKAITSKIEIKVYVIKKVTP